MVYYLQVRDIFMPFLEIILRANAILLCFRKYLPIQQIRRSSGILYQTVLLQIQYQFRFIQNDWHCFATFPINDGCNQLRARWSRMIWSASRKFLRWLLLGFTSFLPTCSNYQEPFTDCSASKWLMHPWKFINIVSTAGLRKSLCF